MRQTRRKDPFQASATDHAPAKLIMEKMGLSKKEFQEISEKYGVPAEKLLEVMQLSKYQFIQSFKGEPTCKPCVFPVYRGHSYQ